MPVAVRALQAAFRRRTARSGRLERSRAELAAIVGGTPVEARIDELASIRPGALHGAAELQWRPWRIGEVPVEGLEHLRAARAAGRGVLLSHVHHGPPNSRFRLGRELPGIHLVVGEWFSEPPRAGYLGYRFEQTRRLVRDFGLVPVPAPGSRPLLAEVLRSGGAVQLALDMPGSTVTRFLGKPVEMASGTARLAAETGAAVVPVAMVHDGGHRWRIRLGQPMDPAEWDTWQELHQALADWHSDAVLASPEYLEDPGRSGAWARATPEGWSRAVAPVAS
ncbi:LpxL/LpxP family acyltransferase [Blastococcus sp. SYSU D00695]